MFENRLGPIKKFSILPNTLGKPLPAARPFDGRIALVGDFDTVKNVEEALTDLSSGKYEVHLYGNETLPDKWRISWLHAHGIVRDTRFELAHCASLVVLSSISAGFPNVIIEALEAGCGVVVHSEFPFKYLPVSNSWRFCLKSSRNEAHCSNDSSLEDVLDRLRRDGRDFKRDNPELIELIESDWEERIWKILG
jgi:hypothetical protein